MIKARGYEKSSPLPRRTLYVYAATVRLNQGLGHIQAEPRTTHDILCSRRTVKPLKDLVQALLRNADPRILYQDADTPSNRCPLKYNSP